MFAEEIRRQAEMAHRAALPSVTAMLWRAYAEEKITEAEAETLSAFIEARRSPGGSRRAGQASIPTEPEGAAAPDAPQDRQNRPRSGVGSRPRTDASLERRRRWAASGRLPPALAARFTLAEQAVLSLVAAETARRKDCRMAVDLMAAVAGVSRSTVKNALREARRLGLVTVEERRLTGFRNDTNVIRIVSPEWGAWLRLARRSVQGIGVKSPTGTPTQSSNEERQGPAEARKKAIGGGKAGSAEPRGEALRFAGGDTIGRSGHAIRS